MAHHMLRSRRNRSHIPLRKVRVGIPSRLLRPVRKRPRADPRRPRRATGPNPFPPPSGTTSRSWRRGRVGLRRPRRPDDSAGHRSAGTGIPSRPRPPTYGTGAQRRHPAQRLRAGKIGEQQRKVADLPSRSPVHRRNRRRARCYGRGGQSSPETSLLIPDAVGLQHHRPGYSRASPQRRIRLPAGEDLSRTPL